MKILQVGTQLFHVDRRTDMTKLIVAFRNFANGPSKTDATSKLAFISVAFIVSSLSEHTLVFASKSFMPALKK